MGIHKDSRFSVWIIDGKIISSIHEGSIDFFKAIQKISQTYVDLVKTCENCDRYYFCNHEDRKIYNSRDLKIIYKKIISIFGEIKISYTMKLFAKYDSGFIINNILLSGLHTYLYINDHTIEYMKKDVDFENKEKKITIDNYEDMGLIHSALLKEYYDLPKIDTKQKK
jgi:hypothetical protein